MTQHRRLLTLIAVGAALVLTAPAAAAQSDAQPSASSGVTTEADDARLEALRSLVPEHLAGLPLRAELQVATGEELAGQMSDDERAVFEQMLAEQGRSLADYVAANAFVPITDTHVAVIQAHRVNGIDAAESLGAWIEIVGLNTEELHFVEEVIDGQEVVLISDDARPDFPLLNMFAAGDVIWMVVAEEDALVEEAVRALSAASESFEPVE